jgi:hypothetical protein
MCVCVCVCLLHTSHIQMDLVLYVIVYVVLFGKVSHISFDLIIVVGWRNHNFVLCNRSSSTSTPHVTNKSLMHKIVLVLTT